MEQINQRLRKVGNLYELDGEPIRRVIGRPRAERRPLQVLWDLREGFRLPFSAVDGDDTYDDEPIRRVVGKARPR